MLFRYIILVAFAYYFVPGEALLNSTPCSATEGKCVAAIIGRNGWYYCGAVVVNSRWLVTTASCVKTGAILMYVLVGSTGPTSPGVRYNLMQITAHPNYNYLTKENDIALLKTSAAMAACPTPPTIVDCPDNTPGYTCGFGYLLTTGTVPNYAVKASVHTVTNAYCQTEYTPFGITIFSTMACTDPQSACMYDGGSPLFVNSPSNVCAVVSFNDGCGMPQSDVWTRIKPFCPWINATTALTIC